MASENRYKAESLLVNRWCHQNKAQVRIAYTVPKGEHTVALFDGWDFIALGRQTARSASVRGMLEILNAGIEESAPNPPVYQGRVLSDDEMAVLDKASEPHSPEWYVAKCITNRLLKDEFGDTADHITVKDADGKPLGTWCKNAMLNIVANVLREQVNEFGR